MSESRLSRKILILVLLLVGSLSFIYHQSNLKQKVIVQNENQSDVWFVDDKKASVNLDEEKDRNYEKTQKKVLILTTWRSGSTFLGNLIQTHPGVFYSFEPLQLFLMNNDTSKGCGKIPCTEIISAIFSCQFSNLNYYVQYYYGGKKFGKTDDAFWKNCKDQCEDPKYISKYCKEMPINVIKTVRMGIRDAAEVFKSQDIFVIHLVRDPRGMLNSRKKEPWCQSDICIKPKTACENMYENLQLAEIFNKSTRYYRIRYEDMSTNPEKISKEILNFLQLTYDESIQNFIQSHTKSDKKKQYRSSTYRDSKATAFAWRNELSYDDMKQIQNVCENVLIYLNYTVIKSESDYKNMSITII